MTKTLSIAAAAFAFTSTVAWADGHCAAGKPLTEGKFTIATGNPAYCPWVLDDAPESGQGFEAAVAFAVAGEMGFAAEDVVWVRSSFDEAIQPGAKNFDVNIQQYSINAARDEIVDFSTPYYTAPMAVLVGPNVTDTEPTLDALRDLKLAQMQVVWQPDWGDSAAFRQWVMGSDVVLPDARASQVFFQRNLPC